MYYTCLQAFCYERGVDGAAAVLREHGGAVRGGVLLERGGAGERAGGAAGMVLRHLQLCAPFTSSPAPILYLLKCSFMLYTQTKTIHCSKIFLDPIGSLGSLYSDALVFIIIINIQSV